MDAVGEIERLAQVLGSLSARAVTAQRGAQLGRTAGAFEQQRMRGAERTTRASSTAAAATSRARYASPAWCSASAALSPGPEDRAEVTQLGTDLEQPLGTHRRVTIEGMRTRRREPQHRERRERRIAVEHDPVECPDRARAG